MKSILLGILLAIAFASTADAQAPADKTLSLDIYSTTPPVGFKKTAFPVAGQNGKVLGVTGGTWGLITGGAGSSTWGSITGTLGDQTDLGTALSGKQTLDADLTSLATNGPKEFFPEDYGTAIPGDGIDDRAAIQAACAAAAAAGGGVVRLKAGVYQITVVYDSTTSFGMGGTKFAGHYGLEIPAGVEVRGAGVGITWIEGVVGTLNAATGNVISGLGARSATTAYAAGGFTLRDLSVRAADNTAEETGILIGDAHGDGTRLINVGIGTCLYHGGESDYSRNLYMENVTFSGAHPDASTGSCWQWDAGLMGPNSTSVTAAAAPITGQRWVRCKSAQRPDTDTNTRDFELGHGPHVLSDLIFSECVFYGRNNATATTIMSLGASVAAITDSVSFLNCVFTTYTSNDLAIGAAHPTYTSGTSQAWRVEGCTFNGSAQAYIRAGNASTSVMTGYNTQSNWRVRSNIINMDVTGAGATTVFGMDLLTLDEAVIEGNAVSITGSSASTVVIGMRTTSTSGVERGNYVVNGGTISTGSSYAWQHANDTAETAVAAATHPFYRLVFRENHSQGPWNSHFYLVGSASAGGTNFRVKIGNNTAEGTGTAYVLTNLDKTNADTGGDGYPINPSSIGATTAGTGAFTTAAFSGVAGFADGSNTLPSIASSTDADNGLYFPGSNTIGFDCGGGERFRMSASLFSMSNAVALGWSSTTASSAAKDTGLSRISAGVTGFGTGAQGAVDGTIQAATLTNSAGITAYNATAIPAGGTTGTGYKFSSTSNLGLFFGSGAPTLSAAQGSFYLRTDGAPYYNNNGTTGWTAVGGGGSGDVTAAANFGTDNVLIRSDGTGKGVQFTGWAVADTTDAMSITKSAAAVSLISATNSGAGGNAVYGQTSTGIGVSGSAINGGTAVRGESTTVAGIGVYGVSDVSGGIGVIAAAGHASATPFIIRNASNFDQSHTFAGTGPVNIDWPDIGGVPALSATALTSTRIPYATTGGALKDEAALTYTEGSDLLTLGNLYATTAIEVGHASDTTLARASAGNLTVEGNALYRAGGTDVPVADGGTGVSTLTAYAPIFGGTTGTGAVQSGTVGTAGQVLTSNGAGALPTFQDPALTWRRNGSEFFDEMYVALVAGASNPIMGNFLIQISGTAAAVTGGTTNASNRPGVANFATGTTTTGRAAIQTTATSMFAGGGAITNEWSIYTATALSDATDEYDVWVGFGDTLGGSSQTDGIYFVYDRNTSVNWQFVTGKAGTRTTTDTGIAAAASTWYRFRIEVNAAGTSVTYFIDDVSGGTAHTTNIPDTSSNLFGLMCSIVKSAGTTSRAILADYCYFKQTFTTQR